MPSGITIVARIQIIDSSIAGCAARVPVQTSHFSAEFGAAAGCVVNAITKSGTN
ncbi:MAG: hypothetical protein ABI177_15320 [Edaphobacter sp.]